MTPAETNMPGSATQVVFALLHPFLTKDSKSSCSGAIKLKLHHHHTVTTPTHSPDLGPVQRAHLINGQMSKHAELGSGV